MIEINAQLIGDRDLERMLDRLGDEIGNTATGSGISQITYDVMEPVETMIRATTPVDTGILRASVGREFDERYTDRTGYPSVVVGWLARRVGGRTIKKQLRAAVAVEFIHDRKVLRNAAERNQAQVFQEWTRRFRKYFDDAVLKSARGTKLTVRRGV